jgi:hypothetical protein
MELEHNSVANVPKQREQTAREKLSGRFSEWTDSPGEYDMILFENCVIHLIEDDAIPSPGLVKYDGRQGGSFFLTRTQLQDMVSKLQSVENK